MIVGCRKINPVLDVSFRKTYVNGIARPSRYPVAPNTVVTRNPVKNFVAVAPCTPGDIVIHVVHILFTSDIKRTGNKTGFVHFFGIHGQQRIPANINGCSREFFTSGKNDLFVGGKCLPVFAAVIEFVVGQSPVQIGAFINIGIINFTC